MTRQVQRAAGLVDMLEALRLAAGHDSHAARSHVATGPGTRLNDG